MRDVLIHDPEGDCNPYEPVAWSRSPLTPTTKDVVRVGVRASERVDRVVVEWTTGAETGSMSLQEEGDTWIGEVGPFEKSVRYRFVADSSVASGWFELPVLRWEEAPFSGIRVAGDSFEALCDLGVLRLTPHGDTLDWELTHALASGEPRKEGKLNGWRAEARQGSLHLASERGSFNFVSPEWCFDDHGDPVAVRLGWELEPDERIFGTGERFDRLDQRGRTPDVRVYEQYKRQRSRTYFPLPWLLSTRGYGLRVDSLVRVKFDLGSSRPDFATVTIPDRTASGRWYFGTPKQVLGAYVTDVGRPSPLPLWAYGPWMSGNEWDRDQRIREVVAQSHREGVPATVIVIEAWSDETTFYLFGDTQYDPVGGADPVPSTAMQHGGRWPDPRGLVDWLHAQGIRVLLWQIPVLKDATGHPQHDADVAYAETAGLCVTTTGGETYRNRAWWFPRARVIDFTNAEARRWWFDKRAYLLDEIGVDGFKTDGGEHLWGNDVVTAAGEVGDAAANAYPTHYLQAYHEFLAEHGRTPPLTFSRAGFVGSTSYPAHWAGDEDSTWEAFRASLTAGLSAGLSGVAFWGWDLAGFSGPLPSAELYKRATAMAAFCPIMQYHSEHNQHRQPLGDRTPWNVAEHTGDPEVLDTYRFHSRLRMNLIPYLATLGTQAANTGMPLMRAMVLEYPDDPEAAGLDDQYLLGPDLLVAPILGPAVTARRVYVPEGSWWDLWAGTPADNGWVTAPAPPDRIPVYVRGGAPIPLWLSNELQLGTPAGLPGESRGRLVLMIFPGNRTTQLTHPVTGQSWKVTVSTEGPQRVTIESDDTPEDLTLWVRAVQHDGTPASDRELRIPAGHSTITVDLAES